MVNIATITPKERFVNSNICLSYPLLNTDHINGFKIIQMRYGSRFCCGWNRYIPEKSTFWLQSRLVISLSRLCPLLLRCERCQRKVTLRPEIPAVTGWMRTVSCRLTQGSNKCPLGFHRLPGPIPPLPNAPADRPRATDIAVRCRRGGVHTFC